MSEIKVFFKYYLLTSFLYLIEGILLIPYSILFESEVSSEIMQRKIVNSFAVGLVLALLWPLILFATLSIGSVYGNRSSGLNPFDFLGIFFFLIIPIAMMLIFIKLDKSKFYYISSKKEHNEKRKITYIRNKIE